MEEKISCKQKSDVMSMPRDGKRKIESRSIKERVSDTPLTKLLLVTVTESITLNGKLKIWFKIAWLTEEWLNHLSVLFAIVRAKGLKDITQIIPNRWKSFGCAVNAITIYTNLLKNVCSLNDQTLKTLNERMRWPEHYGNIVRRSEISSRLRYKVKVTSLSYQGQCITNDLWMQNLRSTGI